MKKKVSKKKQQEVSEGILFDESLEIFGEHKTREQVKAEEKARKKAEREAMKAEMAKRRKEAKEGGTPAKAKDIVTVTAVVVAIVLLCVLALGNSLLKGKEDAQWEINEDRGYILKADCNPEISAEGAKADVLECYFTQNNHLYVEVAIRNGTDKIINVKSIDIVIKDNANGDIIAAGKVELQEDLILEIMDLVYYPVYIAPEHILVDETYALPEECRFEFSMIAPPVEAE